MGRICGPKTALVASVVNIITESVMPIPAAAAPQLDREDQLWAGLSFPVLTEQSLALGQLAIGDTVHFHQGVWWLQARPLFCTPCFPYAQIDHRTARPNLIRGFAGFTHLSLPHTPSNGAYSALVRESVSTYSLRSLPTDRRTKLRKALMYLDVRIVDNTHELLTDGFEVYQSCHQRIGWGRDKTARAPFEAWIVRAYQRQGRVVLGAYYQNKLVAFMLPYVVGNIAVQSYVASHSAFLKYRPNEAIIHAFLSIARQTAGVEMVDFGPVSSKTSLDSFKRHFGTIKHFRSYTWLNPLLRMTMKHWLRSRYPWLQNDHPIATSEAEPTHIVGN